RRAGCSVRHAPTMPQTGGRLEAHPGSGTGAARRTMSNLDAHPTELTCDGRGAGSAARGSVLAAREVPLGGPRAMTVRRTLPERAKSLIGAWCVVDHYGPDTVARTGGMRVHGHPHTGLQTASWLFSGEIEHRDTTGAHAVVRPGELNL